MDIQSAANLLCKITGIIRTELINREKSTIYIRGKRAFKNPLKLGFETLVTLLLLPLRNSIQLELGRASGYGDCASKSAFVQAREKLNPRYFRALNTGIMEVLESHGVTGNTQYKGLKLYGVDGSTIFLPQTKACSRVFGSAKNQHGEQVFARACFLVDLLGGACHGASLGRYNAGERYLARPLFEQLEPGSVCVLDRLYPSGDLFYRLQARGVFFVARCKESFNSVVKAFAAGEADMLDTGMCLSERAVSSLRASGFEVTRKTSLDVRLIRFHLPGGGVEYLITNLFRADLGVADYGEIYRMRWAVETLIDKVKNKLRVEHFSGEKPENVRQDFHAAVCKYNMALLPVTLAQRVLDEAGKARGEAPRKVNFNMAFHVYGDILRQNLQSPELLAEACGDVIKFLVRFTEASRPWRSFPRGRRCNKVRGRCWYSTNHKYCA